MAEEGLKKKWMRTLLCFTANRWKCLKNGHTYIEADIIQRCHKSVAHIHTFLNELFCGGLEIIMIINVEQTWLGKQTISSDKGFFIFPNTFHLNILAKYKIKTTLRVYKDNTQKTIQN